MRRWIRCWLVFIAMTASTCGAWELQRVPAAPSLSLEHLSSDALQVADDEGVVAILWTIQLPAKTSVQPANRIAFPILMPGDVLGVISLPRPFSDYRNQQIQPGTYVLRYAVQPLLKDHLGVSEWRDFALLVPPDAGGSGEFLPESRKVSGTSHPAVLALLPAQSRESRGLLTARRGETVVEVYTAGVWVGVVLSGHASPPDL